MLQKLIVTPRLHGIHHSIVENEMNSNWSSGLALWDLLHGSWRNDIPQNEIVIGVEELQEVEKVTLLRMLIIPLEDQIYQNKSLN